jgi:hypothetical protein
MNPDESPKSRPLRELEWLARYFVSHGQEEMAREIVQQVRELKHSTEVSLNSDNSNLRDFKRPLDDEMTG